MWVVPQTAQRSQHRRQLSFMVLWVTAAFSRERSCCENWTQSYSKAGKIYRICKCYSTWYLRMHLYKRIQSSGLNYHVINRNMTSIPDFPWEEGILFLSVWSSTTRYLWWQNMRHEFHGSLEEPKEDLSWYLIQSLPCPVSPHCSYSPILNSALWSSAASSASPHCPTTGPVIHCKCPRQLFRSGNLLRDKVLSYSCRLWSLPCCVP